MSFSTAPGIPTHWEQTNISLEKDYSLKKGEILRGVFQMGKNALSGRELEFQIGVITGGEAEEIKHESHKYNM